MKAEYSFLADPARGLVRIWMGGFFTLADIRGFEAARHQAHLALECGPNAHVTLNDLRQMKVQSQEIVAAFQAMLAAPEYRSRRLAFVVCATLARAQLMRAVAGRDARCFEEPGEAEAWLFADPLDAESRFSGIPAPRAHAARL